MRALTRYAASFAAVIGGLTIGLAPAAGASVTEPGFGEFHVHFGPAQTTVDRTCEDTVHTTGLAVETITRDGPRIVVRFNDNEGGDGYTFSASGIGTFWSEHHSYRFRADGFWYNIEDPAASFHRDMWVRVFAHHGDDPKGFESWIEGPDCG